MNTNDRIITALTPGTPFNVHGRIFRSIEVLAAYAGITVDAAIDLLVGDLASLTAIKPVKKGGQHRLMAALRVNLPAASEGQAAEPPMIKVAGGTAYAGPATNTIQAAVQGGVAQAAVAEPSKEVWVESEDEEYEEEDD